MTYTLGADISKYQDNNATPNRPDFKKLKAEGCQFVIIRASQNVSMDEDWIYNWKAAKDAGLIRGSYHFHEYRPGIAKPTIEQAKFYAALLKDDPGDIPPAVDYERPNDAWPELPPRSIGLANLEIWFDYMDIEFKKIGMFYSNPNTILYNLRPREDSGGFLLKHYLWIAQYYYKLLNERILQPIQHCATVEDIGARKPQTFGWKTFTFWQFGTPSVGIKLGMESREIDLDVFNGTFEGLWKFCGIQEKQIIPLTLEQRVERLEKLHDLA